MFVLLTFVRSELLYIITSSSICQELFSSFFKFFLMSVALPTEVVHHATFIYYHKAIPFVKNFFQVFSNFFVFGIFIAALVDSFDILPQPPSICQALFSCFFDFFQKHKKGSLSRPLPYHLTVIWNHGSSHSRRRFYGRPQRTRRRYPHPGKQRSYVPTGSSAGQPLPGSWAGSGNS